MSKFIYFIRRWEWRNHNDWQRTLSELNSGSHLETWLLQTGQLCLTLKNASYFLKKLVQGQKGQWRPARRYNKILFLHCLFSRNPLKNKENLPGKKYCVFEFFIILFHQRLCHAQKHEKGILIYLIQFFLHQIHVLQVW